jgi:transcriptional regulator with AAA-type ATPase domain
MKQNLTFKTESLVQFLYSRGFRDCKVSPSCRTLRQPKTGFVLTIPSGGLDLGHNLVSRLMVDAGLIQQDFTLQSPIPPPAPVEQRALTIMEQTERAKIVEILKETKGNKLEAARVLGIGRQTLYNKIKVYHIES